MAYDFINRKKFLWENVSISLKTFLKNGTSFHSWEEWMVLTQIKTNSICICIFGSTTIQDEFNKNLQTSTYYDMCPNMWRIESLLQNMHIVSMGSRDYKRMEVGEANNDPFTILNICVQHCCRKSKDIWSQTMLQVHYWTCFSWPNFMDQWMIVCHMFLIAKYPKCVQESWSTFRLLPSMQTTSNLF